MCMLNHWLEWDKWVLTYFDHDWQWFNTLIRPCHESAAVNVDCISRLSGPVRLALRYTTVDIHCRDRRYEWDGGIKIISYQWLCTKLYLGRFRRYSSFDRSKSLKVIYFCTHRKTIYIPISDWFNCDLCCISHRFRGVAPWSWEPPHSILYGCLK